jgi:hypothetical protein
MPGIIQQLFWFQIARLKKLKNTLGEWRRFGYVSLSLGECARIGTASNSAFV